MKDREGFYAEVGGRIRAERERGGVTQQALATQVTLTRASIANIEKGRQQILLHTLVDIAEALRVDISKLIPPQASAGHEQLEALLRDRPRTQREWVESVVAENAPARGGHRKKGR
jgi:transcriptional regulator with XRE-family HTH domain